MKCIKKVSLPALILVLLFVTGCGVESKDMIAHSPDGNIKVTFELKGGQPFYSVSLNSEQVIDTSLLGLDLEKPFEGGFKVISTLTDSYDEWWDPVYGEYAKIHDNYNSLEILLEEQQGSQRQMNIVFRVYNEGAAFCYEVPEQADLSPWQVNNELSSYKFPAGSGAFPIYRTEQTYSNVPVDINEVEPGAFLPFTVSLKHGFASLLEAHVEDYPRSRLTKTDEGILTTHIYGSATLTPPFKTPWRALLLAKDEKDLVKNGTMVLNLNPPCAIDDVSWIKAGKTISNEKNEVRLQFDKIKGLVDFASENDFKYLQLDWGWYGTEVKWSEEQIESFRKMMPERFKNSEWEINAQANPYTVAKGYVPYGWTERWINAYTEVDLDIKELVNYAKQRGIGIQLYVEAGSTLRSHDLDSLFSVYREWGLAGLKPGFVQYGNQERTNWIRNMVKKAAEYNLLLCIHDNRIPDGMSRTYPNLVINEGGGGQEGYHPVVHDLMLPFSRCLAGPFDYTPLIYTKGRSNTHMLAFLVTYYGPGQTVRGGYIAWKGNRRFGIVGEELEFLKKIPTTWDDTKILQAQIGQHLVTARKSGQTWFIGGMTGTEAFKSEIQLDFLDSGKEYKITVFKDADEGFIDGFCSAQKEILQGTSESSLTVNMLASGGFVAIAELVN